MLVTREELLGAFERRFKEIPLPPPLTGKTVRIRNLNELERSQIEAPVVRAKDDVERAAAQLESPARWFAATVVDDEGKRLFRYDDIPQIKLMDASVTRAVYVAAQEFSGITPEQTVEEHEKNSETIPGDCSPGI